MIEAPLEPGTIIKDRFVLEKRLGEGGMGVVFKARDLRKEEARDRDPYVAIKFLNSEFRRHPEAFMALQRETRRAQALAHPNVVTVHDFDRDGTLIYMTMEFLEGEPLDRFIQRHPQGLRFKEAWPIIEGCSRALAYAHEQGVVHADFKPGNVFVAGERKVKVLDFGIARAVTRHGEDASRGNPLRRRFARCADTGVREPGNAAQRKAGPARRRLRARLRGLRAADRSPSVRRRRPRSRRRTTD